MAAAGPAARSLPAPPSRPGRRRGPGARHASARRWLLPAPGAGAEAEAAGGRAPRRLPRAVAAAWAVAAVRSVGGQGHDTAGGGHGTEGRGATWGGRGRVGSQPCPGDEAPPAGRGCPRPAGQDCGGTVVPRPGGPGRPGGGGAGREGAIRCRLPVPARGARREAQEPLGGERGPGLRRLAGGEWRRGRP